MFIAILDTIASKVNALVPTAFSGAFGDYVADLIMLGLIILWIVVFKKVTWISHNSNSN